MSKLKQNKRSGSIASLVGIFATNLNRSGTASRTAGLAKTIASLESVDPGSAEFQALQDANSTVETELKDAVTEVVDPEAGETALDTLGVTDAALESASIAYFATIDPKTYTMAGRTAVGVEGAATFGTLQHEELAAALPALEAFDNKTLSEFAAHSIAYNLLAPRQDKLASKFFPLIVMTPDQSYFRAEIKRVSVYDGAFHKLSGERTKFKKRHLVEAFRDSKVLENRATEMVPYKAPNEAENNSRFVDAAVVADWVEVIDGVNVTTNYLKFAQGEFSFLGLAQHPGVLSTGQFDQTDKIDTNVRIKKIAVAVKKGTDVSIVEFDISGHASAQFVQAQNAHAQETRVNYRTEDLAITGATKDIANAAIPALAGLTALGAEAVVRLKVKIDGDLNLEFGDLDLTGSAPVADKLFDATGKLLDVKTHAALNGVTFELVGYTLDARRTNSNRRSRGSLLDRDIYAENYLVGLLPPIVVQKSQLDDSTENDVEALISATNLKATNMAITTILTYAEQLKAEAAGFQVGLTAPVEGGSLQGIARTMVTPYYDEDEIDLNVVVNSIASADKVSDVRGYVTGFLSQKAYQMAQNSGYVAALQLVSGNPEAKPCVLIGCDQVLENYIMIEGDDRAFGPGFDFEVVTSMDQRLYNKIVMTFHDKSANGFAPMNFGNCIWIPELVATLPTMRNGSNVNETMVQPRFRHICNLPVMALYTVKNLEQFIQNRTAVLMDNLETANP